MRMVWAAALLIAALVPAAAQTGNDDIMRAEQGYFEPWLAPKYKSPRGTKQRVTIPKSQYADPPRAGVTPSPIMVPETGRVLPNMPATTGRETSQDRALRCHHQAGVYGDTAGNRNAYIGTCINQ